MEDDIFAQLSNLIENKPSNPNGAGSFGATTFGNTAGNTSASGSEMFQPDDVIVPDFKPKKVHREKKLIVVIDDDFSTLDLLKIYLQRDYEYVSFDNPKNAIFYLNSNVPDMIMIDCYLNVMKTKQVVEIIRTYKELHEVPIIYLAEPSEESAVSTRLPEGVIDIITRPVKRADIQKLIENYLSKPDDDDGGSNSPNGIVDHPII